MYISVISFRLGEQMEIFQHETLDDAKNEVKKQLAERVESELMKDLPDKRQGATTPKEIFSQ